MKWIILLLATLGLVLYWIFRKDKDKGGNFKFGSLNIFEIMVSVVAYTIFLILWLIIF